MAIYTDGLPTGQNMPIGEVLNVSGALSDAGVGWLVGFSVSLLLLIATSYLLGDKSIKKICCWRKYILVLASVFAVGFLLSKTLGVHVISRVTADQGARELSPDHWILRFVYHNDEFVAFLLVVVIVLIGFYTLKVCSAFTSLPKK